MYFVSMVVQLQHAGRWRPCSVGEAIYAHAAIIHTLSAADPALGRALHDMKRHKRVALAFVAGQRNSSTPAF